MSSSSAIITIVAIHVTKYAYDSKMNRSAPNALFNSLVTITPVILYDTIKFVKILA